MDDNVPAFPTYEGNYEGKFSSQGLTKREYFAAMAMQAIIANHANGLDYVESSVASYAFFMADAMIKESKS